MKNVSRALLLVVSYLIISSTVIAQKTNTKWQETDLIIKRDSIKIGGTLVIPENLKKNTLVIMNSGSGPQDRDETLFGFKIFKIIAEHLASKGIATFRYDDRGEGESNGDFVNSTIDDLTDDLSAIINYFNTYKKHPFNEFTLFGHSQGGIITSKVAANNSSVKQLILMAAPSVPLVEVVLAQVRNSYANTNLNAAIIEREVSAHANLMRAIHNCVGVNNAVEEFKNSYRLVLSNLPSSNNAELETNVMATAKELEVVYGLPSLSSFLYYDPANDLKRLNIPVLGLFGGNDSQVSIQQNKDRMEGALLASGTQYKFTVFSKANHFFQPSETGLSIGDDELTKAFVVGFLDEISTWIINN
ncbi:alpha/beta hydrolase family protein [Fulvivirga lutimaris]|uniref:alpha/beta hydrolase family protein n=1 Tax=Fulvivirga lutimaris TaxID=1819566 RepID=UPI0012BC34F7|nr:alpha/beta fold hydrolase [Fulvivirga lutimaris]MTI38060.1 alpha/beta fold hydrolase [Fulvivirga lutimaris]